jgi:transcriptional regulator with XRE-family HTH domain
MESGEQQSSTSLNANGRQVAHYRRRRGLTQKQLAQISGYSERLVRKAEASGSLSERTIRDLAGALSSDGDVVNPEDLICSPESLALEFMAAFAEHEAEMIAHVEHFLDPAAILVCAGDPEKIPFAGEWHGISGFDRWVRSFFATLIRPEKDFYQPESLSQGNTVVLWGQELAHARELPFPPIWVTQRFEFREGKIIRFDNLFDTDSGSEHLAEAKARGFLQD